MPIQFAVWEGLMANPTRGHSGPFLWIGGHDVDRVLSETALGY